MFRRVSADVYAATSRAQLPELSLSVIGEYYLRGRPQPAAASPLVAANTCAAAETHWRSALSLGTVVAFEDHLRKFAYWAFAGLARERIAEQGRAEISRAEEERKKTAVVASSVTPSPPPATPSRPAVGAVPESRGAKPLSSVQVRALKPTDSFKECDNCPEMVVVPAGSFTMGSAKSEKDRRWAEGPQRRVSFARQFAVG